MTEPEAPKEPQDIDIHDVVLLIQQEQIILAKDKEAQVGTRKTHYADLGQVNDVVLKRLNSLQTTWVMRSDVVDGAFGLHYSLRHLPSKTELTGIWPIKLSDDPQRMGSATTYGRRYALLTLLGIVSEGDDDDGKAAGETVAGQHTTARRAARPAPPRLPNEVGNHPVKPGETAMISKEQIGAVQTLLSKLGIKSDAEKHAKISEIINEPVQSTTQLTRAEAGVVITTLGTWLTRKKAAGNDVDEGPDTPPNTATETV